MNPKQVNYLLVALTVAVVIASCVLVAQKGITQALDIRGGVSVILTAEPAAGQSVTQADMEKALLIITQRVNKLGASETSVQRQGDDALLVQIPGIKNEEQALKIINTTGKLEFVDVSSLPSATAMEINAWANSGGARNKAPSIPETVTYTPVVSGDTITNAMAGQASGANVGQIVVTLTMNAAGTAAWRDYTGSHVGKQVAIVLDRVVQSAPSVNEQIPTGETEISGSFTVEEANYLATVLQTGSLPIKLEPSDTRSVGPTLGQDSLRKGILAALVGLAIVGVYLMVFYRGLGLIAVLGLGVFSSMFLGLSVGPLADGGVRTLAARRRRHCAYDRSRGRLIDLDQRTCPRRDRHGQDDALCRKLRH